MMDEMRLKLSTKWMKGMVAKILEKAILKSVGYRPRIHIEEIMLEMRDGKIGFKINAGGEIDEKVLEKVNRIIDSDD